MPKKFESEEKRLEYYRERFSILYSDPEYRDKKREQMREYAAKKRAERIALIESGEIPDERKPRGRPRKYV